MTTGRDFVVLADDWNGAPCSTRHLFGHLATRHRVFWWNIVNRLPRFTPRDLQTVAATAAGWVRRRPDTSPDRRERSGPGVVDVGTPFMIPWFKRPIRRLNCALLLRTYHRLARQYDIRNPVIFTIYPSTVDFVKAIRPATTIYCCVDDWLHYPGLNARDFRSMEDELLESVDAFVATSGDLEQKGRGCRSQLYLPHGVEFTHFHQDATELAPVPELEDLPRPIVGFFGLLAEWIDLPLIARLSEAFPHVSFVLIGKSVVRMDAVSGCRGVHCLGPVRYAELPRYARYFDVGLIPFVKNKLTEAVNPLKLLEYYAVGLPVLATRLPELERIGGPVHLAVTPAEFCDQLRALLAAGQFRRAEAVELASRSTWERRAGELTAFLDTLPAPHP